jgi:ribonuclease-3
MNFLKKIGSNSRSQEDGIFFEKINKLLGFKPTNLRFYKKAFTHRSANIMDENGNPFNYERLEFLGDAILGSIISSFLYKKAPTGDEGYLTKTRSKIVSREHLNELGSDFNLFQFVESKVATTHFGENIHGNLFEAFIGAIYLDKGFDTCEKFIEKKIIIPYVDLAFL